MSTRRRRNAYGWRSPAIVPVIPPKPRKPRPKANTAARGYGAQYRALRKWWSQLVLAGGVECCAERCLMPQRAIRPGEPWDLGHSADRTVITGPEHRRCNRSDGARRGNASRQQRKQSRQW